MFAGISLVSGVADSNYLYSRFVNCNDEEKLRDAQAHTEVDVNEGPHAPHGPANQLIT